MWKKCQNLFTFNWVPLNVWISTLSLDLNFTFFRFLEHSDALDIYGLNGFDSVLDQLKITEALFKCLKTLETINSEYMYSFLVTTAPISIDMIQKPTKTNYISPFILCYESWFSYTYSMYARNETKTRRTSLGALANK